MLLLTDDKRAKVADRTKQPVPRRCQISLASCAPCHVCPRKASMVASCTRSISSTTALFCSTWCLPSNNPAPRDNAGVNLSQTSLVSFTSSTAFLYILLSRNFMLQVYPNLFSNPPCFFPIPATLYRFCLFPPFSNTC